MKFNQNATQHVDLGDDDAFTFSTGSSDVPFSVSLWMYPTSTVFGTLLSKYQSVPNVAEYGFYSRSNGFVYILDSGGLSDYLQGYLPYTLSDILNKWTHLVFTYDGSGSTNGVTLYRNAVSGAITDESFGSYTYMTNTATPLRIGARKASGGITNTFLGSIADVRIFDRALSADEISNLYRMHNGSLTQAVEVIRPVGTAWVPGVGNLVSYWRPGLTGDATDYYGSNNGSLSNATATAGTGFAVDTNAFVYIPDDASLDFGSNQDFSISAWVKTTNESAFAFTKGDAGTGGGGEGKYYGVYVRATGVRPFAAVIDDNTTNIIVNGTTKANDGVWHHCVGTFDRDGLMSVYFDGVLEATTDISSVGDIDNGNDGLINGVYSSGVPSFLKAGTIDEVAIYTNALSAQDVWHLYTTTARKYKTGSVPNDPYYGDVADSTDNITRPTGTSWVPEVDSVVSYWRPGLTADATDYYGSNDGSLSNGAVATAGTGFDFSGYNDDYVIVPSNSVFYPGTNDFSVSAWVYLNANQAADDAANGIGIAAFRDRQSPFAGWNLLVGGTSTVTNKFNIAVDDGPTSASSGWGTAQQTGEWIHVVGSVDRDNAASLYINGSLDVSSTAITNVGSISGYQPTAFLNGPKGLAIGAFDWTDGTTNDINGLVDEVVIYTNALSAQDVWDLYTTTKGKYNSLVYASRLDAPVGATLGVGDVYDWSRNANTGNASGGVTTVASPLGSYVESDRSGYGGSSSIIPLDYLVRYDFDSNGNDSGPNSYHLVASNSATASRTFPTDDLAYWRINDTNINIAINNYTAITVSAWAKLNTTPDDYDAIVTKQNGGGGGFLFLLRTRASNTVNWAYRTTGLDNSVDSSYVFSTGVWFHAVGTYQSDGSHQLWVDNVVRTEGTSGSGAIAGANPHLAPLTVGASGRSTSPFYTLPMNNGEVDNVRIYLRVLTTNEINQLYNEGHD